MGERARGDAVIHVFCLSFVVVVLKAALALALAPQACIQRIACVAGDGERMAVVVSSVQTVGHCDELRSVFDGKGLMDFRFGLESSFTGKEEEEGQGKSSLLLLPLFSFPLLPIPSPFPCLMSATLIRRLAL